MHTDFTRYVVVNPIYVATSAKTLLRQCHAYGPRFGTDIEDGPLLRPDHKSTPKWAWPRSRDQISNFGTPLITFERIEISAINLAQTYRTDSYFVRITKRPQSGRGLGHVTEFRNFGTPL